MGRDTGDPGGWAVAGPLHKRLCQEAPSLPLSPAPGPVLASPVPRGAAATSGPRSCQAASQCCPVQLRPHVGLAPLQPRPCLGGLLGGSLPLPASSGNNIRGTSQSGSLRPREESNGGVILARQTPAE